MIERRSMYPPPPRPEQIKKLRTDAGLTQQDIAAMLYMTPRTVQGWEAGTSAMPPAFFELLCAKVRRKMRAMRGASALPPQYDGGPTQAC